MWPYVLLVLIPIIVRHVRIYGSTLYLARESKTKDENTLKLFWGILLGMLVLRHEVVGTDTHAYHNIFNHFAKSSWSEVIEYNNEVGYSVFNKIVSLCTDNFRWILILSAFISVYFMAKTYIKYSEDASLTIALLITTSNFVMLFSGLRQAIAISLGFLAFEFVKKKRIFAFLITVIVAIMFHTSAFMILFMYPLYHARITKNWMLLIVPMLGVLFVYNEPVFGYLTEIMSRFTEYDATIASTGAYTMLILYGTFAVFSYVIPDEDRMDQEAFGMRNFLLFSVALQMFAPLHTLAMRMNYYYMAFIPLAIPKIIKCRSQRWNQVAVVAKYVMVIFFIAYFFITLSRDNPLSIYPYHFMWETV